MDANDVVTVPPSSVSIPNEFAEVKSGKQLPGRWMAASTTRVTGCPVGLECLSQLDQLYVFEELTGNKRYRYQIKNSMDEQVYYAYSEFTQQSLCDLGATNFHVVNGLQQEVMKVNIDWQWCTGCCWCVGCSSDRAIKSTVESPPGQPVGHIQQRGSCWKPVYGILDASHEPVLEVSGLCPGRSIACGTCDLNFRLVSLINSRQIGKITNTWAGLQKECFTNADDFVVQFPKDLDVKVKGTVLGTLFLFDSLFFRAPLFNPSNAELVLN